MSMPLEAIKSTLSGLPTAERAELAHYLLRTLEPQEEGTADAWLALAERRMADARAGQVTGVPAEEVLECLRRPPR